MKENDMLLKRFRHLLQSKTIRQYDEMDNKGNYKRNPVDLDKYINDLKDVIINLQIENNRIKEQININKENKIKSSNDLKLNVIVDIDTIVIDKVLKRIGNMERVMGTNVIWQGEQWIPPIKRKYI